MICIGTNGDIIPNYALAGSNWNINPTRIIMRACTEVLEACVLMRAEESTILGAQYTQSVLRKATQYAHDLFAYKPKILG